MVTRGLHAVLKLLVKGAVKPKELGIKESA
jgi:hypothetical protein